MKIVLMIKKIIYFDKSCNCSDNLNINNIMIVIENMILKIMLLLYLSSI